MYLCIFSIAKLILFTYKNYYKQYYFAIIYNIIKNNPIKVRCSFFCWTGDVWLCEIILVGKIIPCFILM